MHNRPSWYTNDHDNAWERVKGAFRNDWEQTKHDFGVDSARDLDQDVGDTVRQATGADDFERHEPAFRFGHAAQRQYRTQYPSWNNDLETQLRKDYGTEFDRDRRYIRYAYDYRTPGGTGTGSTDEQRDRL